MRWWCFFYTGLVDHCLTRCPTRTQSPWVWFLMPLMEYCMPLRDCIGAYSALLLVHDFGHLVPHRWIAYAFDIASDNGQPVQYKEIIIHAGQPKPGEGFYMSVPIKANKRQIGLNPPTAPSGRRLTYVDKDQRKPTIVLYCSQAIDVLFSEMGRLKKRRG